MQRRLKFLLTASAAALLLAPTSARADGWFAPFAGVNFGSSTNNDGRGAYGINAGGMGAGIIGGELDFGYLPHYYGNTGTIGTNYVLDLMGNLIVGVPVGGTHGAGVRPYGTVGFGWMRSHIAGPAGTLAISNDDPGINVGAGVMGFFNDNVGLRGDVRYFRDVHNNSSANQLNIDVGSLHFWRASIGVVFR